MVSEIIVDRIMGEILFRYNGQREDFLQTIARAWKSATPEEKQILLPSMKGLILRYDLERLV